LFRAAFFSWFSGFRIGSFRVAERRWS
jgi:hypothetical protein